MNISENSSSYKCATLYTHIVTIDKTQNGVLITLSLLYVAVQLNIAPSQIALVFNGDLSQAPILSQEIQSIVNHKEVAPITTLDVIFSPRTLKTTIINKNREIQH